MHEKSDFAENVPVLELNLFFVVAHVMNIHDHWYGVVKKKVNDKREEKMHWKMKMTSQRAENLVHVQQHHGKHFSKKIFFLISFYIADMAI